MMSIAVKRVIALVVAVAVLGIAYYGSYLPMKKSQAFISGLRTVAGIQTFGEFREFFHNILVMPSPIGREELVRHLASSVTPFINDEKNTEVTPQIILFVEDEYKAIMDYGTGMSFTQNIFVLATMYQAAFVRTGDARYLEAAKQNYLRGIQLAPNRPQFLYGLFDVYRMLGDRAGVLEMQKKILENWPNDERVTPATEEFLRRLDEFERMNGPVQLPARAQQ